MAKCKEAVVLAERTHGAPIMEQQTDKELIEAYFSGDAKSLELLVVRYLGAVFRFVRIFIRAQEDAEDITQEIFVKAWKNLAKFDREKSFRIWLFAIAKNSSLDHLRRKKEIPFSRFEDEQGRNILHETMRGIESSPYEHAREQERKRTAMAAIGNLAPEQRAIIALRLREGFSFSEIGEVLGEPLATVKSRYRRALIRLRDTFRAALLTDSKDTGMPRRNAPGRAPGKEKREDLSDPR